MMMLMAVAALAITPPPGVHRVEVEQFVAELPAGNPAVNATETVTVYFPSDLVNGPYPVVSFAHAMFAGGPIGRPTYRRLMNEIASYGFIVVAPESCLVNYCTDFWKDQLAAIDTVKNVSNCRAFEAADLTHVGVAGHGMGGQASEQNAGPEGAGYNIYATALLNPQSAIEWAELIHVPAFYTTGSLDDVTPPEEVKRAYEATTEPGTYFLNLQNGTHNECTNFGQGRLDRWVAVFFKCHLQMDQNSCQFFDDNICQANPYVECIAK